MAIGVLNWAVSNVAEEQYKIVTLDGKVDSLDVIDLNHQHKTRYQRWDIKLNMPLFEKALYVIAKHKPEKFREIYSELKSHDMEFWGIANVVLRRIHNEYAFN